MRIEQRAQLHPKAGNVPAAAVWAPRQGRALLRLQEGITAQARQSSQSIRHGTVPVPAPRCARQAGGRACCGMAALQTNTTTRGRPRGPQSREARRERLLKRRWEQQRPVQGISARRRGLDGVAGGVWCCAARVSRFERACFGAMARALHLGRRRLEGRSSFWVDGTESARWKAARPNGRGGGGGGGKATASSALRPYGRTRWRGSARGERHGCDSGLRGPIGWSG